MKNLVKFFGDPQPSRKAAKVPLLIIALVAVIGFTMVACGGGGKIPNGKYVDQRGNYFVFSGNKVSKYSSNDNLFYEGTYVIDKDGLFVATDKDGKQAQKSLFDITGKTLQLGMSDTYEKQ